MQLDVFFRLKRVSQTVLVSVYVRSSVKSRICTLEPNFVDVCSARRYNLNRTMILKFAHKGLERFYATGSKAGINPQHADKLSRQLSFWITRQSRRMLM